MHLLFVYGTLKKGLLNSHYLKYETFLGEAKTLSKYPLIDGKFPSLIDKNGMGFQVKGELYDVADITYERLDKLESHPHFYHRKEIAVIFNNNIVKAFCYFKTKVDPLDLEEEFLEEWKY